jgi:hypothetical protein
MRKVIAVVLLLVGIGLSALGAYEYFFSGDQERCQRFNSLAEEKLNEARAAQGTPREAALMEEARVESAGAEAACRNARQTQQRAMLIGLGGLASIIVSVVLLVVSRKRTA